MTAPTSTTTNTAETGAFVGIQAEQVHDSTVYIVLPETPPGQRYEIGLRYLAHGVPARARDLINDAIARGHDNAEVRFHWVLAMLSKRSFRDLSADERTALDNLSEQIPAYPDDEWKAALEAIHDLVNCQDGSESNTSLALANLRTLPLLQREAINRHLDLVLTGGLKDSLWAETRKEAETHQLSGDRLARAWTYFQMAPAGARVRRPTPVDTTPGDLIRAVVSAALFALAAGYLGWLVLRHAAPFPVSAYLIAAVAGVVASWSGLEWSYRATRMKAKELIHLGLRRSTSPPEGGFTDAVRKSFQHYATKYAPTGPSQARWLDDTAGVFDSLSDEIAEIYREEDVKVGNVNWLIRDLVWAVKDRWLKGELLAYEEKYRTPPLTKLWCVLSLTVLTGATIATVVPLIRIDPLYAGIATFVVVAAAPVAASRWIHILCERRRYEADRAESDEDLVMREAWYDRWSAKLESLRPTEGEMEEWLNHDKTMLLDEALRLYRLAWRDVIAYAVLQTPAKWYKRACVSDGPWRYSRYDIRLFLITQDGVRELGSELDFQKATFRDQERDNYRFDAVSSVHVEKRGNFSYTLELTLTNGPTRNIRVMDATDRQPESEEESELFSKINLDAAGFAHTLHILEGIAAEGKGWITRDPYTHVGLDALGVTSRE